MPLYRAELQRRRGLLPPVLIHDPSQVLYLPFDKDDGSYARDRSGYVNHGTIYGATRVAGKIGGALSFDGVNDYVDSPHSSSLDITDALTVMAWVKFNFLDYVGGTGKNLGIGGKGYPDTVAPHYGWLFSYDNRNNRKSFQYTCFGNSLGGYAGGGNNFPSPTYDYTFTTDKFYFLAFTIISTEAKLYIDGVQRGPTKSISNLQLSDVTRSLRIGRLSTLSVYFNGIIDEVRIYNRALSAAEIARLMNMRGI